VLEVRDLACRHGRVQVLFGVSLDVGKGELVALVGANGAGKTTLLRAISGVHPAASGSIRFAGAPLDGRPPHVRLALGVAQVPEGRQVFAPLSVADNLRLGAFRRGRAESDRTLAEIQALFPILRERGASPAGMLSGGQQQMLALGRALMSRPALLLLDEPSMGLAPLIAGEIFRAIRKLCDGGTTILLVEQNARAALSLADRAYVLETGRIVAQGKGQDLLADERIRRAYLG
jgi:branched-chain amino acid transport system ATP-binding protein